MKHAVTCHRLKGQTPSTCKKDVKNEYDPQIGAAAQANARLAERSMQFSEDYFTKYVAPALQQATRSQAQESANQKKLFDLNYSQATKARDRYEQYGIPAENSYYQMVRSYSEPQEQERQAALALGDVRTAAGSTRGQMMRQFASMSVAGRRDATRRPASRQHWLLQLPSASTVPSPTARGP